MKQVIDGRVYNTGPKKHQTDLTQYPRSAVRSYCELMLNLGHTLTSALAELNEELRRRDRLNRLYEWLAGSRPVPDDVRQHCARSVVGRVLRRHGVPAERLTDAQLDAIADSLS